MPGQVGLLHMLNKNTLALKSGHFVNSPNSNVEFIQASPIPNIRNAMALGRSRFVPMTPLDAVVAHDYFIGDRRASCPRNTQCKTNVTQTVSLKSPAWISSH
mmetsp:Transcript_77336/g.122106  ORF Transcript_77336/g.122106 Transcript_77336/m.122106 type:complete len:102 (-) Transcript_77336:567-872(-)